MVLAAMLLVVGLGAPYLLSGPGRRGSCPRLMIGGQVAGVALVWLGLVGTVAAAAAPDAGWLEWCRSLVEAPHTAGDPLTVAAFVIVVTVVPGRSLLYLAHAVVDGHRLRRAMHVLGGGRRGIVLAHLATVACTVGVLRPKVVVDPRRLAMLSNVEQRIVVAHERGHARGLHGLIDLAVRSLAAGPAPWRGARLAVEEVRRHLEAAADDRAARFAGRRAVASAIVAAAGPPPAVGALVAAGWAMWRVDRLLRNPAPPPHAAVPAIGVAMVAAVAAGQLVARLMHGLLGADQLLWSVFCCAP